MRGAGQILRWRWRVLHCNVVIGADTIVSFAPDGVRAATEGAQKKKWPCFSGFVSCGLQFAACSGCWAIRCEHPGHNCMETIAPESKTSGKTMEVGRDASWKAPHDAEKRASTEEGRIFAAAYHRLLVSPSTFISVIGQCARYQCWGKIRTW